MNVDIDWHEVENIIEAWIKAGNRGIHVDLRIYYLSVKEDTPTPPPVCRPEPVAPVSMVKKMVFHSHDKY